MFKTKLSIVALCATLAAGCASNTVPDPDPTDEMAGDERGKDFFGLHHIGFVCDDLQAAHTDVESNGGRYHMKLPNPEAPSDTEHKFRDPDGVVFDIVNDHYARNSWGAEP